MKKYFNNISIPTYQDNSISLSFLSSRQFSRRLGNFQLSNFSFPSTTKRLTKEIGSSNYFRKGHGALLILQNVVFLRTAVVEIIIKVTFIVFQCTLK